MITQKTLNWIKAVLFIICMYFATLPKKWSPFYCFYYSDPIFTIDSVNMTSTVNDVWLTVIIPIKFSAPIKTIK